MCGVAGILGSVDDRTRHLRAMVEALRHRGPDGEALWSGEHCALGHRRLAIIDLSPAGYEVMDVEAARATISFNGEVYNFRELRAELQAKGHRFHSHTDTEVVLRLYLEEGERFVERLDGMFAVAIWDCAEEKLLLARDPYGQKPLFYLDTGECLAFASEIKALRALPWFSSALSPEAIDAFLTANSIPAPLSIYRSVRRLHAGTLLVATPDGARRTTRFVPRRPARARTGSLGDAVREFDDLFGAAVRRQLVADVPVGLFLSGGIDSSLLLERLSAEKPTGLDVFTVAFDEGGRSELEHARRAARRFGASIHVVTATADLYASPATLVDMFDEPFADVAMPALFDLARAARRNVTVVLTGDGGDELFGGYETHVAGYHLARTVGEVRRPWLRRLGELVPDRAGYRSSVRALRRLLVAASGGWPSAPLLRANLSTSERSELLLPHLTTQAYDPYDALRPSPHRGAGTVESLFDPLADPLLSDLFLHKTDVTTMASGLEARSPFLDRALVDFAGRLPLGLLVHGLHGKRVPRALLEQRVDTRLGRRRKTGFSPPLDVWLRTSLTHLLDEYLGDPRNAVFAWVSAAVVTRLISEHRSGARNHRRVLWSLILLEAFLRGHATPAA